MNSPLLSLRARALASAFALLFFASACNHRSGARAKYPLPLASQDYSTATYESERKTYFSASNATDRKTARNHIVLEVMRSIDLRHHWMTQDLLSQRSGTGLAFDVASLAGASLGTVSNGARGKSIISAVLAGVVGTKVSLDKNWFQNQGVNALISAMRTGRARIKDKILANLAKSIDEYPLELAESDVVDYYAAGTLTGGLQELHEETSKEAEAAKNLAEKAIPQVNPITDDDRAFAQSLRKWIDGQKANPDSAKIAEVYAALVEAKFIEDTATTDLQRLNSVQLVFRRSAIKGSGVLPADLSKALSEKLK